MGSGYNPLNADHQSAMEPRRDVMNRLDADRWTYADYLQLPDDGTRCEILEGERVMTPAPFTPHQRVALNLVFLLGDFLRPRKVGTLFFAPCDVILAEDTVVQPDVLFVAAERTSIIQKRGVFGPPDLMIEIVSESDPKRDTVRKLRIYGRHGVREYWIVDPERERVEVFVLEGRELVRKAALESGELRSLVVLPGFVASLSQIFARSL
jgi:Uma2 family endonuclease